MNVLAFLFLLAFAVWSIPWIKDGRLPVLISMLFLVGTIFGPPFFAIDGPIQISLDRVLWMGMMGLAVVQWRLGNIKPPSLTRIDACLIGLMVYLFWRSRGGDITQTIVDPTARWVFYIFIPTTVFFLARIVSYRRQDFRLMQYAIIALGLYLSVTAVFEVKGWHAFVFPKHILDPEVWLFLGRGRGPLLNPIGNGFLIGTAMAAVASLYVGASRNQKALCVAIGVVLLVGGYATLTRSCWLGVAGAGLMVGLVHSPRWVRFLGLAAAVLLMAAMMGGLKDQLLELKRDKDLSAAEAAKSVELRPLLATVAWEMFKDKPILGHGYGQYLQRHDQYLSVRKYDLPLEQVRPYSHHNTFLAFLVDSGLIGLGLFCAALFTLATCAWNLAINGNLPLHRRRVGLFSLAILANYLPNAMFHNMTIIPMVQVVLLGTAGVVIAIYQKGFERSTETARSNVQRRRLPAAQEMKPIV